MHHPKPTPRTFLSTLLLTTILMAGCVPRTVEVVVTSPASVVEVTATPSPVPTATVTPQIDVEQVSFTTEDDVEIAGTLFAGEGDVAVVLAHQGTIGADQRSWHPFARFIAGRGFTALTFDFRGYGQSGGERRQSLQDQDVDAAIGFLRDRGFSRIVCMGASMGGTACIESALGTGLEALVVVASTMGAVAPDDFARLTLPKLFVCTEDDAANLAHIVTEMHDLSPEPKELVLLPGTVHGTELFNTEYGDEFRDVLVNFLEGLR